MTIQDWGAIGELVGGLAIIISLIYVGLQIRQSTLASKAEAHRAYTDNYISVMTPMLRPDFSDIYWRGRDGLENLEGREIAEFLTYINMVLRYFESYYIQKSEGTFESRIFKGWSHTMIDLFAYKGAKEALKIRKHQYDAEYIAYLENLLASTEAKDMYQLPGNAAEFD